MNSALNVKIPTQASNYPLITKERTQKLDLLQHLVANIARAIVVCGPEGVGKTRLLKVFQETPTESSLVCWIKGDSQLTIEKIQALLGQTLKEKLPQLTVNSLDRAIENLSRQKINLVVIIDDAGQLAPGFIETIIAYSNGKPALRLIFALTHSELYLKTSTDPAVEDCYQIEIPPLSEKQCGEFLEYLSTLPRPRIQFNSINETNVGQLYLETHGIPGNILKVLPKSDSGIKKDYSKIFLVFAVSGLIAVALGVQWWSAKQTVENDEQMALAKKPKTDSSIQQMKPNTISEHSRQQDVQPPVSAEAIGRQNVQSPSTALNQSQFPERQDVNPSIGAITTVKDTAPVASENTASGDKNTLQPQTSALVKPAEPVALVENQQPATVHTSSEAGENWIKAEPVENYTLQLMALPNEQTVVDVIQRNQSLSQNLRYIKTKTRAGRDRFVLVYGSYPSIAEANKEKDVLPKELQKTWIRKIASIQKELLPPISPKLAE